MLHNWNVIPTQATEKYRKINTVLRPTAAYARPWLAHGTWKWGLLCWCRKKVRIVPRVAQMNICGQHWANKNNSNVPQCTGGRLQPVLMRHRPQLSVKTWGGGSWGGGRLEGLGGGGGRLEGLGGGGIGWRVWGGGGRLEGIGCGGRLEGAGGGAAVGGGVPNVGGPTRDPQQPHAYLQGGCVSEAGLGKLPEAVVKQGLQIGRCVHSGCGDLHFATNGICLAPRLSNLALKTWMV